VDDAVKNGIGCQRDEQLLVLPGSSNSMDHYLSQQFYKKQGLQPTRKVKGELQWWDLCEIDSAIGPTLPCPWLEWDPTSGTVSMKESEKTIGTVIIAHGKESGPQGNKIKALAQVARKHRLLVIAPDFRGMDDPEKRVCHLLDQVRGCTGPLYLAGSSMGGYVAIRASQELQPVGLFLMAPAIGIPGYAGHELEPACRQTTIVHAWEDDIIPPGNVIAWAELYQAELHLVNDNHRLSVQTSLLKFLFDKMLRRPL
jgi:alpha/beta superfamily hydrolase